MLADQSTFVHDYGPALIAFAGLLLHGLLSFASSMMNAGRRESDLDSVREWKLTHEEEAHQRDQAIAQLKEIAASSKATADGQERRLRMLEERRQQRGG
ncbi:MAG: hypothetical protein JWQ87_5212 [Candidatus Sulfotelmatobacter sp.]|nr:hypothetical protein [Candidatus Sulfotelmatobacter sp.]